MKKSDLASVLVGLIILITTTSLKNVEIKQDEIIGKWLLPDGIELEIFKTGNTYEGKIVELHNFNNGQTKDIYNTNKLKKQDLLIGKIIMQNLMYDAKRMKWISGTIYNPGKGITANLEIVEVSIDNLTAIGSKLLFSKEVKWTRVSN
ncbi:MAG: DUF2147 domain-containing protein [Bacteroidales bacterium]|jgi:hypothetical protein|nr:DUF2147 domain-containing protein [Bacteroidales bacterium]